MSKEKFVLLANETEYKRVNFSHPLTRYPLNLAPKQFFVQETPVSEEKLSFFSRLEDLSLSVYLAETREELNELISNQKKTKSVRINPSTESNKDVTPNIPAPSTEEDVPNDVNPKIPDGATVGSPIGFAEETRDTSTVPEELKSVGADYASKGLNDVNPKIPAGSPEGQSLGTVETPRLEAHVEDSPVGVDGASENPESNDANPLIPAGAPEGESLGTVLPTSIREETSLTGNVDTSEEGVIDTTNGHADSSRQAVPAPDATKDVKPEPNKPVATVSEGEADSARKQGLPERSTSAKSTKVR